jgi:hypothetical protein
MRHVRIVGLSLVAVLALSAGIAASASAETLPAIYECAKAPKETVEWKEGTKLKKKAVYTGAFNDKKCSEPNTTDVYRIKGEQVGHKAGPEGKYEFQPWNLEAKKGIVKVFKGKGAGSNLDVVGLGEITCTSSSDEGYFTGPKTAGKIKVTFKGCEVDGEKCHSASAAAGEIKTNTLDGEIGYINEAKKEVGADLKPESSPNEAEFACGVLPLNVLVKGSVIGVAEPINKFSKEATLTFERLGTTQLPTKLEGGLPDTLVVETCGACNPVGSGEKESGMQSKVTNKGEELELVA